MKLVHEWAAAMQRRLPGWHLPRRADEWMARGAGTMAGGAAVFISSHVACLAPLAVALALPNLPSDQLQTVAHMTGAVSLALGAGFLYRGIKLDDCCVAFGEAAGTQALHFAKMAGAIVLLVNGVNSFTTDPGMILDATRLAAQNGQSLFDIMASICTSGTVAGYSPS